MIKWGIILFIATLIVDLITDYRRHLKGTGINHTRGAILRLIGLVPAGIFLSFSKTFQVLPHIWVVPLLMICMYWIIFNGFFNVLIGQKWGYLGTTAWLDRKEQEYPWLTPGKYIGAVASIIMFIILQ